jgi:hypothetical protein
MTMKFRGQIFLTVFFLLSVSFCFGQTKVKEHEQVKVAEPEKLSPEEPKYKTTNPDSTKFPITKADLIILCNALNISKVDSIKCSFSSIWLALSDPIGYSERFVHTRMPIWSDYNKPVLAGWSLCNNESEFLRKVILEGFFNPLIYSFHFSHLDTFLYSNLDKHIKKLSAYKRLIEDSIEFQSLGTARKTAREVLVNIDARFKKHGYSLLVIYPQENATYKDFPFDAYNGISIKQEFEGKVIGILKKLGLKAVNPNYLPKQPLKSIGIR